MPRASRAACWKYGEYECATGSPIRPTRRRLPAYRRWTNCSAIMQPLPFLQQVENNYRLLLCFCEYQAIQGVAVSITYSQASCNTCWPRERGNREGRPASSLLVMCVWYYKV